MLGNPLSVKGGFSWALFGLLGAIVALTIGHFMPGLIPARARGQSL